MAAADRAVGPRLEGHQHRAAPALDEADTALAIGRRTDGLGAFSERHITDPTIRHAGLHHGASYLEHEAFALAITDGGKPAVTLDDGLMSVAVGVAAHRSIELGRAVTLEEVLGG